MNMVTSKLRVLFGAFANETVSHKAWAKSSSCLSTAHLYNAYNPLYNTVDA